MSDGRCSYVDDSGGRCPCPVVAHGWTSLCATHTRESLHSDDDMVTCPACDGLCDVGEDCGTCQGFGEVRRDNPVHTGGATS